MNNNIIVIKNQSEFDKLPDKFFKFTLIDISNPNKTVVLNRTIKNAVCGTTRSKGKIIVEKQDTPFYSFSPDVDIVLSEGAVGNIRRCNRLEIWNDDAMAYVNSVNYRVEVNSKATIVADQYSKIHAYKYSKIYLHDSSIGFIDGACDVYAYDTSIVNIFHPNARIIRLKDCSSVRCHHSSKMDLTTNSIDIDKYITESTGLKKMKTKYPRMFKDNDIYFYHITDPYTIDKLFLFKKHKNYIEPEPETVILRPFPFPHDVYRYTHMPIALLCKTKHEYISSKSQYDKNIYVSKYKPLAVVDIWGKVIQQINNVPTTTPGWFLA